MYSVSASEFCNVDVSVMMYDWDFSQFAPLEYYVAVQEDRKLWAHRDHDRDNK
jgi:hypothetical protein